MKGFGDDIMLGVGGFTKFYGGTGFDWASFEQENAQGISADMQRREFVCLETRSTATASAPCSPTWKASAVRSSATT